MLHCSSSRHRLADLLNIPPHCAQLQVLVRRVILDLRKHPAAEGNAQALARAQRKEVVVERCRVKLFFCRACSHK